jgi:hypothetical protein
MALKTVAIVLVFAATTANSDAVSARRGDARIRSDVTCDVKARVYRQFQKHPERWGTLPPSLVPHWSHRPTRASLKSRQ